jgi:hypothetical protein
MHCFLLKMKGLGLLIEFLIEPVRDYLEEQDEYTQHRDICERVEVSASLVCSLDEVVTVRER